MSSISSGLATTIVTLALLWGTVAHAGQVSPTQKLVWAHAMIVFPLDLDVVKPWLPEGFEGIYPAYPLDARRNWPAGNWTLPDVKSGKAAGLNGFSVDIFANGDAANDYLTAADAVGDFHIAACLDGGSDEEIVKAVTTYCDNARNHPSAARIGDAFVIFTYGTGADRPERWRKLREQIAAQGYKTWWMPDLGADFTQPDYKQKIAAFFPIFEAGYNFGSAVDEFAEVAALFKAHDKPYGGGMMPGYFRLAGGYNDAQGTLTYRNEWRRHLASRPNWAHISTWDDLAETTEIMPNSDFNTTRSEMTAWFAAKFRDEPIGWKSPRLYITTPKTVYSGQDYKVEGLVLNPLDRPVQVTVQLLDARRRPWGRAVTASVPPAADGAAVVTLKLDAPPPGRFLRARATLRDGATPRDGAQIMASVLSAPITVLDAEAQPGFATLYYSIPAHQALPGEVKMVLNGWPVEGKTARVSVIAPPGVRAQFSEDSFSNHEILRNFLAATPTPLEVPRRRLSTIQSPDGAVARPAGEIKGGTAWGFYMTRVTDTRYRVGYSDPIYIAPRGDLTLKEYFSFDEGHGTFSLDTSAFQRAAGLQDVEWISPGAGGSGSAVRFNGRNSRLSLTLGLTPPGPLSIKMEVRPRAYGGLFFCDAGGMWMTTTTDGKPQFVRLSPDGFIAATGKNPLPLNEWTPLEFIWDGAQMKIFVSGQLVAQTPCAPQFGSWRRALGMNPFGSGSEYYNGDLDNFRVTALK